MLRPEASGTLVSAALGLGIPAMATELGGGGGVRPQTLAIASQGLDNVLAYLGMIARPQTPPTQTRLMGVEPGYFLRAPGRGIFEPKHELGGSVNAGEAAGRLWCLERPEREPEPLYMPADGLVVCRRVPSTCAQADVLLHLARDIEPGDLIDPK
jgi:N-alpha-acetyl-L-2,4-diaminobutyrate deacetylase